MEIFIDEIVKIGLSLLLGSLLGIEREFRSHPAGFRTIALICVGATLFTVLSQRMGSPTEQDRIAANIITGIGFIGAGVIFKQGYNVYGLTTAATIWIAAGMGMCVGVGEYVLSVIVLLIALTILSIFEYIQQKIDIFPKKRYYTIHFIGVNYREAIEAKLHKERLSFEKNKEKRDHNETTFEYEVQGSKKSLDNFNEFLLTDTMIVSFEY